MSDDRMRQFIGSLPNVGTLDADERSKNERIVQQRIGGLSPSERQKFENELRALLREQDERLTFKQKWRAAQQREALKKQLNRK